MQYSTINKWNRRLTTSQARDARLAQRAAAIRYQTTWSETDVSGRSYVNTSRPATRRPWASRVSRQRVLPVGSDAAR
ncbi:MAG: hypothetical protein AAGG07_12660 [Planctomycetota bacterium]